MTKNSNSESTNQSIIEMKETIISQLQGVYDPEFPLIDIYTMGLIYEITVNEEEKSIHLLMTLTSPSCPAGEIIEQMIRNAIISVYPEYMLEIEVTFEPPRTYHMMKDDDLKRMFE
ncbi:DUF59 domain-containing protein [Patescibacteria group bacterium]|nr:DUF59 domain-containing protein [Patescibacteria group bacterium]